MSDRRHPDNVRDFDDWILVADERADSIYDERQHWMCLSRPTLQTVFLVLAAVQIATNGLPDTLSAGILVGAAVLLYIWIKNLKKAWLYVMVALAVFTYSSGPEVFVLMVTFGLFIRLGWLMWLWSTGSRLIVTKRRVLTAGWLPNMRIQSIVINTVTDISVEVPIVAQILATIKPSWGFMHVRVETTGQDQALSEINFIKDGHRFYDQLIRLSAPIMSPATGLTSDGAPSSGVSPMGLEIANDEVYIALESPEDN